MLRSILTKTSSFWNLLCLPQAFVPAEQDLSGRTVLPPPQAATGGFLDYDFIAVAGQDLDERVDGLMELGAFSPFGIGLSSFQLADIAGEPEVFRLETTFTKDFPENARRYVLAIA